MTVAASSVRTYKEGKASGTFKTVRERVHAIFRNAPEYCFSSREVARIYQDIYGVSSAGESVRNRITDLTKMGGLVCYDDVKIDPISGRRVNGWVYSGGELRPLPKRKSRQKEIKELKAELEGLHTAVDAFIKKFEGLFEDYDLLKLYGRETK